MKALGYRDDVPTVKEPVEFSDVSNKVTLMLPDETGDWRIVSDKCPEVFLLLMLYEYCMC